METLLWICSTAAMLALLGLLALRALEELLGIRVRLPAPRAASGLLDPANWPWPAVFAASLALLWLGALAGYLLMNEPSLGFFTRIWTRFTQAGDAPHYLRIAQYGYASAGEYANEIVFYPLYPLLMGMLGRLLDGRYALSGMLLSQVCYGLAGVMMAKLAKKDCPHPGAALAAFWLYPFGYFCLGVYTEGLFLLLTLLGLWAVRGGGLSLRADPDPGDPAAAARRLLRLAGLPGARLELAVSGPGRAHSGLSGLSRPEQGRVRQFPRLPGL